MHFKAPGSASREDYSEWGFNNSTAFDISLKLMKLTRILAEPIHPPIFNMIRWRWCVLRIPAFRALFVRPIFTKNQFEKQAEVRGIITNPVGRWYVRLSDA